MDNSGDEMTRVYRLALATLLVTLALIVVGSLARLHPAGTGCGNEWPLCNGQIMPPLEWAALVEVAHRILAISVLLLAGATTVAACITPEASARVRALAVSGLAVLLLQIVVGGLTAVLAAPALIAVLHLTAAMLFIGLALATTLAAAAQRGASSHPAPAGPWPVPNADRRLALVATAGATIVLFLVVFGAATSTGGAAPCTTWPGCEQPEFGSAPRVTAHLGYQATALLGALAAGGTLLAAYRSGSGGRVRFLAMLAVLVVIAQTALNAAGAAGGNPAWVTTPQLFLATLLWVILAALALAAWSTPRADSKPSAARVAPAGNSRVPQVHVPLPDSSGAMAVAAPALAMAAPLPAWASAKQVVADYIALTKPGIMSLLLTTTFCAMLIAERGLPPLWLVVVTLLGGVLASGGASVLNCYIDRDIDGEMSRTRNRAIVAGRVSPQAALIYGVTLSATAVLMLGIWVNWLAALLALAGNLFYVLIYTLWLKRSTPYNIVIGGAAGAAPPLVGWAAVTGDLTPLAWGLFLIIFAWTPPHFWALALLKQGEYTRAAVPMLPVVRGELETRRQILFYTAILAVGCVALTPFGLGWIYLVGAIVLNGLFLAYAVLLYRKPSKRAARQMFFYSLWYLAGIFAVAVIDRVLLG
ncbi:MAG: heme o synthase [Chloroflexota bacterium]|nr:heme o synthase [Chloroflexota bacterium]